MSGIVDVQARIGEIQGFMSARRAQATNASTSTTTLTAEQAATSSSATTTFADALAASMSLVPATTATTGSAGAATATATTSTATGQGLVAAAMAYVGVPYVWGGEDPATGLDCSGLVQRSLADLGVDAPRVARDQARLGTAVASIGAAMPGDLLIFDGGSHIAIYVGDGRMVDAPKPGRSVSVRDVYETPSAIRRVLPAATVPADAASVAVTSAGAAASMASAAPTASTTLPTSAVDLERYALTMMSEGVAA